MSLREDSAFQHYRYVLATSFKLAIDSVWAHKLRSFLTLLGVIIGVASVVLVGSAIEGLGVYAEESTSKAFGTNTYLVAQVARAGNISRRELFERLRRNKPIRYEEVQYLRLTTGEEVLYSPYRQRLADVKRGNETMEDCVILGVSATLPEIRDVTVVDGRFITDQEERNRLPVAVVGEEVRTTLFPNSSPVGKTVRISGIDFLIVGVQEKLGSAFGRSQDNSVYIPYPLFQRIWGSRDSIAVFGRARPGSELTLEGARDLTRSALRVRFKTPPGKEDNFDTLTPDAIRGFVDSVLALVAAVVVPVTSISLVVGGIVIMNIMLVSVTERTREIGVRKSLGARVNDIRLQFLLEAVILAAMGGVIGLAIGWGLVMVLSRLFELTLRVTPGYVFLALFVSSTVGIVSGWYPASRAAKLDPVVALRAE